MASGFKYELQPKDKMPEMCRVETIFRLSGGYNLDIKNLSGIKQLPPLCPLVVDHKTRKAVAVVNVEVYEKITAAATALKVKKGSLAYVGMHLGNGTNGGTVQAIDKSNAEYDLITLKASPTLAAEKGAVLFEATAADGKAAKATANALNYAWTDVEEGATVTPIGQVYEIRPSKLIVPISEKDKASLGDRFMFTY